MKDGSRFEGETLDMLWPEEKPLPRQYWWDTDPSPRTGALPPGIGRCLPGRRPRNDQVPTNGQ
jgi:hypothetical protein